MVTRATSISSFCISHGISRSTYYNLKALGDAPREMRVGSRVLITEEASAEWRRRKESQSPPRSSSGTEGAEQKELPAALLDRIFAHAESIGLTAEQFLSTVLSSSYPSCRVID